MRSFDALVAEADAEPVAGWDFSWLEGRATEARPSWGYARLIGRRLAEVRAALDIQTGGGEVLAGIPHPPPTLVATESWPPNVDLARRRLGPLGATVVAVEHDTDLPFPDACFDLVVSRHPVTVDWPGIARILRPAGSYLSQHVGPGSVRELTDALLGPQPVGIGRSPERARADAEAAGLDVVQLQAESLPMAFHDIGAVVYFLRKVIWIVPGFTTAAYDGALRELDARIRREGPFAATSERFLIDARRRAG